MDTTYMTDKLRQRIVVGEVFTPSDPVRQREFFAGRMDKIERVAGQLVMPGQHAVLSGARGVGKSSLAYVALEVAGKLREATVVESVCDPDWDFAQIVEPLMNAAGFDYGVRAEEQTHEEGGRAGFNVGVARGGVDGRSATKVVMSGVYERANSPGWVARQVKDENLLLFVDDVDMVGTAEVKKLAVLMKHLSDAHSHVKLLIVGGGDTLSKLAQGHPSVLRCVGETYLDKMSDDEIAEIVTHGARRLGLEFSAAAVNKIVRISSGFPHFTHLMALEACTQAIVDGRQNVGEADLTAAIEAARGGVEESLQKVYGDSVRSYKESARDKLENVLIAAAMVEEAEFSVAKLRECYGKLGGGEIVQGVLSNYLGRIVANDESRILRRIAQGVYKFNDPRMPSYIKFVNMDKLPNGNGG